MRLDHLLSMESADGEPSERVRAKHSKRKKDASSRSCNKPRLALFNFEEPYEVSSKKDWAKSGILTPSVANEPKASSSEDVGV